MKLRHFVALREMARFHKENMHVNQEKTEIVKKKLEITRFRNDRFN